MQIFQLIMIPAAAYKKIGNSSFYKKTKCAILNGKCHIKSIKNQRSTMNNKFLHFNKLSKQSNNFLHIFLQNKGCNYGSTAANFFG